MKDPCVWCGASLQVDCKSKKDCHKNKQSEGWGCFDLLTTCGTFNTNDCVISESQETESWYDDEPFHLFQTHCRVYTYELVEFVKVKVKTKEEIAAEESVAKAKEALKAAENALKVVKEKK